MGDTENDRDSFEMTRRSLLVSGAAVAGTAMVGSTVTAQTTSYQPLSTDEMPDGTECEVCGMMVKNFPVGNTQLVKTNGDRRFFCSPGCLTAYYVAPSTSDFIDILTRLKSGESQLGY